MIKILAAVDSNWAIGFENQLLFKIPQDLSNFKKTTEGNYIIMGRHTFESILSYNGKPLSNRINCVLTRNREYEVPLGVFKSDSVEHIINHYGSAEQSKDLMVIGGSKVYKQFISHADEVLLTHIEAVVDKVDSYFPREELEKEFYIDNSKRHYCEVNELDYYFVTYKRKSVKSHG